jgi:hypothetical protein
LVEDLDAGTEVSRPRHLRNELFAGECRSFLLANAGSFKRSWASVSFANICANNG